MARLTDGGVIVAGWADDRMLVARYTAAGALDPSFGDAGVANADLPGLGGKANAVILRAGGRILVAGESDGHMAIARLTGDGRLDPGFGSAGSRSWTAAPAATSPGRWRSTAGGGSSSPANPGRMP